MHKSDIRVSFFKILNTKVNQELEFFAEVGCTKARRRIEWKDLSDARNYFLTEKFQKTAKELEK